GIYPDHRYRANQIIHHHHYRMQEMLDIVRRQARTAYEVASLAFGFDIESPLTVQFPATFETLAHLEYLRSTGKLAREEQGEQLWLGASRGAAGTPRPPPGRVRSVSPCITSGGPAAGRELCPRAGRANTLRNFHRKERIPDEAVCSKDDGGVCAPR